MPDRRSGALACPDKTLSRPYGGRSGRVTRMFLGGEITAGEEAGAMDVLVAEDWETRKCVVHESA